MLQNALSRSVTMPRAMHADGFARGWPNWQRLWEVLCNPRKTPRHGRYLRSRYSRLIQLVKACFGPMHPVHNILIMLEKTFHLYAMKLWLMKQKCLLVH